MQGTTQNQPPAPDDPTPPPKKRRKQVRLENKLSEQELIFCREYVRDFNATRAVLAAGITANYASARVQGAKLLANSNIIKFISELVEEVRETYKIDISTILHEWAIVAKADITHYRLSSKGDVLTTEGVPEVATRAVKTKKYNVTTTTETTPEGKQTQRRKVTGHIELQDKFKAQKALYDHLKQIESTNAGNPDPAEQAGVAADFLVRLGAILQTAEPAPGGTGSPVVGDTAESPVDAEPGAANPGVPDAG